MKDIKRSFDLITLGAIVLDAIYIILSIFFIANPSAGPSVALRLFGLLLIVTGIYSIIKYILNGKSIFRFELVYGIISFVVGLLAFYKPFTIANLIAVLVGAWLIVTSAFKFAVSLELRKCNEQSWTFDMGISALTIFLGILLIINPFNGFMVLETYVAVLVAVYAAMDMVEQFFIRKRTNRIVKFLSK